MALLTKEEKEKIFKEFDPNKPIEGNWATFVPGAHQGFKLHGREQDAYYYLSKFTVWDLLQPLYGAVYQWNADEERWRTVFVLEDWVSPRNEWMREVKAKKLTYENYPEVPPCHHCGEPAAYKGKIPEKAYSYEKKGMVENPDAGKPFETPNGTNVWVKNPENKHQRILTYACAQCFDVIKEENKRAK